MTTDGSAIAGPELPIEPAGARKAWKRAAGFVVGALLLGLAAWVIYRQRGDLWQAWGSVKAAPPWLIAAAVLLPFANWIIISLSFWVLMRRYGRIGPVEMSAAIGAAWLMNFLPLRAGMFGRVAYHKAVNRIAVRDSLRVMITGMVLGALAVGLTLAMAAGLSRTAAPGPWVAALAAPVLLSALAMALAGDRWRWAPIVFLLRYLDVLVWIARYAVLFALIGAPISLTGAVAVAAACQLALVVPLVGNGLGIREWAVGLTAAALPPAIIGVDGGLSTATGLTADFVNRAAELLVAMLVGQISLAYLARRIRASRRAAGDARTSAVQEG